MKVIKEYIGNNKNININANINAIAKFFTFLLYLLAFDNKYFDDEISLAFTLN